MEHALPEKLQRKLSNPSNMSDLSDSENSNEARHGEAVNSTRD